MRYLLIHPTHRKFVRFLRSRFMNMTPVLLNEDDRNDLLSLVNIKTMPAVTRHKMLYKIFIRARYRPYNEFKDTDKVFVVDPQAISQMEKLFFKAEWKNIGMTIKSSFLLPLLRRLIKILD